MSKFKHLESPYSFKKYYSKYPEGYTIFEALLNWLDEVNKMIDVLNITLEQWEQLQIWVNEELANYAQEQLLVWLNDGTLDDIINESLFNQKADKTYVDGVVENMMENIDTLEKINMDVGSVLEFGADTTGVEDSFVAFRTAFETYTKVIVPKGNFKISQDLKILSTDKVSHLTGLTRDTSKLLFVEGGLIVEKNIVQVEKINITRPDDNNKTGNGITLSGSSYTTLQDIEVTSFGVGVNIGTSTTANVKAELLNVVVGRNKLNGFVIGKNGGGERNNITLRDCYAVSNGDDIFNKTRNGTKGVGNGYMITSSYGVSMYDCVAEYNTGSGLWVSNEQESVKAFTALNTYFEGNRYAQMYIDNHLTNNFESITIKGSIFHAGNSGVAPNAISEKRVYLRNHLPVLTSGYTKKNINIEEYSYAEQITKLSRTDPVNMLTVYNDLSVIRGDDISTKIYQHEGIYVLELKQDYLAVHLPDVRAKVIKGVKYRLIFDYLLVTDIHLDSFAVVLSDESGNRPLAFNQEPGSYTGSWVTVNKAFTPGQSVSVTPSFIANSMPSTSSLIFRNVRLIKDQV